MPVLARGAIMGYGDLRAGQTVHAIVTDHPDYPKVVHEGRRPYAVYTDRETAARICAAWNSSHGDTLQPWPFYVLETVVQPVEDDSSADAGPQQAGLFE